MHFAYGKLGYNLPSKPASDYAKRALEVLRAIQQTAPATLPIFLSSNSVLTISGVRPYDAYHTFYDIYDRQPVAKAIETLRLFDIHVLYTQRATLAKSQSADVFELAHGDVYNRVWQMYSLPKEIEPQINLPADFGVDALHVMAWSYMVETDLRRLMYDNVLPKAWLQYYLSAHDLRFGMLLGYPAKAIEYSLYSDSWYEGLREEDRRKVDEPLITSQIHHADAYFAARPDYMISVELRQDPQIIAHQKLWSDILDQVYESDWHKLLKADPAFLAQVELVRKADS